MWNRPEPSGWMANSSSSSMSAARVWAACAQAPGGASLSNLSASPWLVVWSGGVEVRWFPIYPLQEGVPVPQNHESKLPIEANLNM